MFDCEEPNIREINFKAEVITEGDPRDSSVMALEMLYVHFQGEKYSRECDSPIATQHVYLRLTNQLGGPFPNALFPQTRYCMWIKK